MLAVERLDVSIRMHMISIIYRHIRMRVHGAGSRGAEIVSSRKSENAAAEVHFRGTLPYRLACSLSFLADASWFEGFDSQIYVLRASLSDELRKEIDTVFGPLGKHVILRHLWRDQPEIDGFASLIASVSQIRPPLICEGINASLHGFAAAEAFRTRRNVQGPAVFDELHLREFLLSLEEPWSRTAREDPAAFDQILRLLQDPTELKARLVLILTQFWSAHYQQVYDECEAAIERSLRHYAPHPPAGDFGAVYRAVTGRDVPDEVKIHIAAARRIVFVPSCHVGLFATAIPLDQAFETVLIPYNCKASEGGPHAGTAKDLFPMVKALSDETRLRIVLMLTSGELYSQQIVDRLDLSQPSVSRHLSLLVAGGILSARWEGGMKFYRINDQAIRQLTERLSELKMDRRSEGEEGES